MGSGRSNSPDGRTIVLDQMENFWNAIHDLLVRIHLAGLARFGDRVVEFGLDHWRTLPRAQTPPWPDQQAVDEVGQLLSSVPHWSASTGAHRACG